MTSEYLSFNKTVRDTYQLIYEAYLKALIENEIGICKTKDELGVYCHYNQSHIAKKINKSIRTVNGAIRKLKDEDLIYVVPVGFQQPAKIYVKNINKKRAILF